MTGAARGIGRAIAQRLAEEGCTVGVIDLAPDDGEAAAHACARPAHASFGYAADVTDAAAVERAVAAFEGEAGGLDALVNNAGWDRAAPFVETDAALWRRVIDVNLYGPLHVTHAVLPRLLARGGGRIVSIASDAGRVGSSGEAVYAACKAGIVAFTKSVAREVARSGVTLNCVSPGPTDTALLADLDATGKLAAGARARDPAGPGRPPEDMAGAVAFLLSDDAAYVTGQVLSVSGGLTMS